jgi:hypothetical protein
VQFGAQLGVDVGVRVGLGVDVGAPAIWFVKITSVTPLPISSTSFPLDRSLLIVRESGLTSISET